MSQRYTHMQLFPLAHIWSLLSFIGRGVCLCRVRNDLYYPTINVEIIFYLVYDIETIFYAPLYKRLKRTSYMTTMLVYVLNIYVEIWYVFQSRLFKRFELAPHCVMDMGGFTLRFPVLGYNHNITCFDSPKLVCFFGNPNMCEFGRYVHHPPRELVGWTPQILYIGRLCNYLDCA